MKNPDRHIVTRKGIDAKIICTDGSIKAYPIFALIQNEEGKDVLSFTNEGINTEGYESSFDLFFVTENKNGWINLCKSENKVMLDSRNLYDSEKSAKDNIIYTDDYITTIKIEWEE